MSNSCETGKQPKTIIEFLKSKSFIKTLISIFIGGIAGGLYFYFIGCSSGNCGITSSATGSILMGSALGFFVTNNACGCRR